MPEKFDINDVVPCAWGVAQCLQCAMEWRAVWTLGAEPLECPTCGSVDTVRGVNGHVS